MNPWLVCGVAGTSLGGAERRLLADLGPGGVILFARNVGTRGELSDLVRELRALPSRPYVAIDLEGGKVNRLAGLLGPLPAAAEASSAGQGALEDLGAALGAACAHFAIDVDYAPVLDVARAGGWLASERRCLADTPQAVARGAATVLAAIERYGVRTCLKHYPGLGSGTVDSHRELPLLSEEVVEDERLFHLLADSQRAVMVAHALCPSLGEPFAPASLSRVVVGRLRATGCGVVIADDVQMGALEAFGSIAERSAAALLAGCHQVPVCNALEEREAVAAHVRLWARRDRALAMAVDEAARRVAAFARVSPPPVPWDEVERLAERSRRRCGVPP